MILSITKAAQWLGDAFHAFDHALAYAMHALNVAAAPFFNGLMRGISLLGDNGIFFLTVGAVFVLFRKTRKTGLCMLAAIALGALVTNLILKPLVARPRPYADMGSDYYAWWQSAGAATESDLSFPSGHVTATAAAMVAVFLTVNKKFSWVGLLLILLMGASRIYLMVHFASDVLFAIFVGSIAGVGAWLLLRLTYGKASGRFSALLNESSVVHLFQKKNPPTSQDPS